MGHEAWSGIGLLRRFFVAVLTDADDVTHSCSHSRSDLIKVNYVSVNGKEVRYTT